MSVEAEIIAERAMQIVDQIPTFMSVNGCMDCQHLFRHGNKCPYCQSAAVCNLADILNRGN